MNGRPRWSVNWRSPQRRHSYPVSSETRIGTHLCLSTRHARRTTQSVRLRIASFLWTCRGFSQNGHSRYGWRSTLLRSAKGWKLNLQRSPFPLRLQLRPRCRRRPTLRTFIALIPPLPRRAVGEAPSADGARHTRARGLLGRREAENWRVRWLCRLGLHKWKRFGYGETLILRCVRCGKEREPMVGTFPPP